MKVYPDLTKIYSQCPNEMLRQVYLTFLKVFKKLKLKITLLDLVAECTI